MSTVAELLEMPDAFREWAQSKKPRERLGERGIADLCPLAIFLVGEGVPLPVMVTRIAFGSEAWEVVYGPVTRETPDRTHVPLPQWATAFAGRVDHAPRRPVNITARRALAILDEVTP